MEERLVYFDAPGFLPEFERGDAAKHPLYLSHQDKVVTISHHLAHAYSAFAVSPFEDGVVMIVDGVGSYRSDVDGSLSRQRHGDAARARVRELLQVQRHDAGMPEEGLDGAGPWLSQR